MAPAIRIALLYWLIALVSVLKVASAQVGDQITLETQDGRVFVGLREQTDNVSQVEFNSFLGIPYAAPPKRYEESELLDVEPGTTHYATTYGSSCPQNNRAKKIVQGNENCLFINVHTPHGVNTQNQNSSGPLLPVLFFVHGGGMQEGSGDLYGAKRFIRNGEVVLVTFNYRLGVLSYLSTGDKAIPGNLGSLDQIVALKWVNKYIQGFGGDPHRVTIVGSSGGAALAHALVLSPRARGLFHGAIIQSGSALCDWAVNDSPRGYAKGIGEYVGCPLGDSWEYLSCLRGKPIEELLAAHASLHKFYLFPMKASLTVDTWRGDAAFLPAHPRDLMAAGSFAQVPVIAGLTQDEGIIFYANVHAEVGPDKFRDRDFFDNVLLPVLVSSVRNRSGPLRVTVDAIKAQYFKDLDVEKATQRVQSELTEMLGDSLFNSCHWEMLEKFAASSTSPVYSYVFSYKTLSSPSAFAGKTIRRLRQMGINHPLFDHGTSHGDEVYYLFDPVLGIKDRMSPDDEIVANRITRAWIDFATTGNPTPGVQSTPNTVPWTPIKPDNINYYNITLGPSPMGKDFRKGESFFWLRTLPYIQDLGLSTRGLENYPTYLWITVGIAIVIFAMLVSLILWSSTRPRPSKKRDLHVEFSKLNSVGLIKSDS